MKNVLTIALLATSFAAVSTSAFADNDAASREAYLAQLSGQHTVARSTLIEGRQSATDQRGTAIAPALSEADQLRLYLATQRDAASENGGN